MPRGSEGHRLQSNSEFMTKPPASLTAETGMSSSGPAPKPVSSMVLSLHLRFYVAPYDRLHTWFHDLTT